MLVLPTAAQIHLARENRRLTICGSIEKNDGSFIRCTQHDEDIEVDTGDLAGVYDAVVAISASDVKSNSDLSVDNMEVTGYMTDALSFAGFNADDIDAGLFANAPFQTFLCQWDDPTSWQKVIRRGFLGDIKRTAEGQFQVEWRGLLQPLQQSIGRTLSERCDVKRFGDARCKKDAEALITTGTVTNVTSNRVFRVDVDASPLPAADYFTLGEVAWLTGDNAGYAQQQVKRDTIVSSSHSIELWEEMPNIVHVGDTLLLRPGCNRTFEACKFWENTVNFRGHGRWIPGIPNIIRAP
jgi:uncharacterized phage protein (TIGR02218 family)